MPISQEELGQRLRKAREASGLTQEQVAAQLRLSRPTVAQIELGNRSVSSIELDRFVTLLSLDIKALLAEEESGEEVIQALFRSNPQAGQLGLQQALSDCIELGHQLMAIAQMLDLHRSYPSIAAYSVAAPKNKWDAIQAGAQIAKEERRRLGLGLAPLSDLVQLLEGQGIRTGAITMPDEVSGITIRHPRVGFMIVINSNHPAVRQRFSWCHEYAHVLLDRDPKGLISQSANRGTLTEVRANSFAASFLLPEEGIKQSLAGFGKGASPRIHAEIFDEEGVVPIDARLESDIQEFQLYDVVQLANYYGVSVQSSLYRLRNLRLLSEPNFEALKRLDDEGLSLITARALGLPALPEAVHSHNIVRRSLSLALEAYRRKRIGEDEFHEIAQKLGIDQQDAACLLLTINMNRLQG